MEKVVESVIGLTIESVNKTGEHFFSISNSATYLRTDWFVQEQIWKSQWVSKLHRKILNLCLKMVFLKPANMIYSFE